MNHSTAHTDPDVVVIGGGLAGLAAAAMVAERGRSVRLYEVRKELGGQARSTDKDGFTFNQGPHALYRGGPAERILTDLGVRLAGGAPPAKGRVVVNGQTEIAPGGPLSLLRTGALSWREKVAVGKTLAALPKFTPSDYAGQTVNDWVAVVAPSEVAAQLMHALVRLSTYAHHPDQLSAEVAIGQMQSALGPGVLYLDGGWQSMVDQLRATPGVEIVAGERVEQMPDARAVIVAVGSPAATSALTGTSFDVGPEAAASCLDLGLRRRPDCDFILGADVPFYFSNHSAVADLAPEGKWHATSVQYLAAGDDPDVDLLEAFSAYAGVDDADVVVRRRLHRMVTVTAMATAAHGGLAGRPGVADTGHSNVFMAGDWVGPTGHLADASLASAELAVAAAMAQLDLVAR